jgi:hypothetical protein
MIHLSKGGGVTEHIGLFLLFEPKMQVRSLPAPAQLPSITRQDPLGSVLAAFNDLVDLAINIRTCLPK